MRHRSLLYLLSSCDLSRSTPPLTDVYHEHTQGPVFTLGTRLIAYATNGPVSNSDPVMSTFHHGIGTSLGVLNGEKDVKGAAKDIAKEMVNGMKTLSGIGYQTLSTYLSKPPQEAPFPVLRPNISPPLRQEEKSSLSSIASTNSNANSNSNSNSNTNSNSNSNTNSNSNSNTINTNTINTAGVLKKTAPSGMIMIRDLHKLSSARSLSGSTLAHFRPHLHAITCLTFNAAGTLVMSVSKQGRTFHIFSILPSGRHVGNAAHLYSLSRGYTDAQVEDCQFSLDSMWCVISTARGTAHVYAINPYGGKPEITGHVSGRVNNQVHHPLSRHTPLQVTSLGSTVRIKQRRPMPAEPMPLQDTHTHPHSHPHSHPHTHTHTHTHPHSHPPTHLYTTPHHTHPPPPPRAKLTTHFLSKTRTPYLVNNSHFGKGSPPTHQRHTSLPLSQTPLMVLRNPASSLGSVLSSFGSSVAGSPIGSLLPAQRSPTWAGGKDKAGDHRLFEFDEEEDALEEDATKMVDETGYQDLYSFHPQGVLTLHRCWVMKSVVKRREQGRVIEKLGLSIKEEDVAEWQVSRSSEWGQVKFPLQVKESKSLEKEFVGSPSTEQVQPTQPTQPVQAQKNASKAAKKAAKAQSTPPPSVPEPKTTLSWLSSAEINTYANVADEPALWTLSQFHLQTYDTSDLRALEEMLALGHVPPTHPICVRKDIPEPYSSRIDRVGKTTTRITNKEDENLEDALAELQDNISKAMQTSFASSPTLKTPLGSSPGQMSKWLSTSTGGMGSSHGSAGSTARSPMQISSVSFEDAYLISMGGAPGLDTNYESNEFIPVRTSHQGLENSSLIRFDEDEDESRMETQPSPEETGTGLGEIFSPDGDNEVAYPSDSVFEEFMYKG
ncbi:hypothetical protein BDF14DRAFT_1330210 [Spinellus fusiger]|nr:hypothetical protein BDF14DRAFT_1330210 [Spinellus fusiger]